MSHTEITEIHYFDIQECYTPESLKSINSIYKNVTHQNLWNPLIRYTRMSHTGITEIHYFDIQECHTLEPLESIILIYQNFKHQNHCYK